MFFLLTLIAACCVNSSVPDKKQSEKPLTGEIDTILITTDFEQFPVYVYKEQGKVTWIVFPNDTLKDYDDGNQSKFVYDDTEGTTFEILNDATYSAYSKLTSPESPSKPIKLSKELLDFASSNKRQLPVDKYTTWFPYYFFEADSLLKMVCYYTDTDFDGIDELIVDLEHPEFFFRYVAVKNGNDYYLKAKQQLYHEFSCEQSKTEPHPKSGLVWTSDYASSSCGGYCVMTGTRFHKGKLIRLGGFIVDQYLDSRCATTEDESTVWTLKSAIKSQTRIQVIITITYSEYTYKESNPQTKKYLFKAKKADLIFNWNESTADYEWDNSNWPWLKGLPDEAPGFGQLFKKQ